MVRRRGLVTHMTLTAERISLAAPQSCACRAELHPQDAHELC